jgi:ribosomal protein S12 methylthiotransferase accessory factor
MSAELTLNRIKPLLSQFGIEKIVNLTHYSVKSCPVFQIVRSDCRSPYFNAGKGFSVIEALVSGLMEAIEVHCYERADPILFANVGHCAGRVKAWNHRSGSPTFVDASCVFREDGAGGLTNASPNGIASGNTLNEALCHALCEMIERHALAGFYQQGAASNSICYQQLERVAPAPDSLHIQVCLRELKANDTNAEFIMISVEAGVSVFICFLDLPIGQGQRAVVQGYGAHPDPKIAMSRALGEAVQILALCPIDAILPHGALVPGERVIMTSKQTAQLDRQHISNQRREDYNILQSLRKRLDLISYEYVISVDDDAQIMTRSSAESLQSLLDGLDRMGVGPVVSCIISPPDLPLCVVKCFCPGLDCVRGL